MTPRHTTTRYALALIAALAAGSAFAQTPQTDGSTPSRTVTTPQQVPAEANAIVPYADNAGQSAAPTIVRDCQKRPEECREPLTSAETERAKEEMKK